MCPSLGWVPFSFSKICFYCFEMFLMYVALVTLTISFWDFLSQNKGIFCSKFCLPLPCSFSSDDILSGINAFAVFLLIMPSDTFSNALHLHYAFYNVTEESWLVKNFCSNVSSRWYTTLKLEKYINKLILPKYDLCTLLSLYIIWNIKKQGGFLKQTEHFFKEFILEVISFWNVPVISTY